MLGDVAKLRSQLSILPPTVQAKRHTLIPSL
jgi:hypothetical protein